MIPLIIDMDKIMSLREHAEEESNRIPLSEMYRILNGEAPCVGDREGYSLNMDLGFRLVFSIEEHPRTNGGTTWGRHMSVSLTEPSGTRCPSIEAVKLLCDSLGFKPLSECMVNFNKDFDVPYVEVFCEMD